MTKGDSGPVLEVQNVSVAYGRVLALEDASISVSAGQIYGLVGPNGAGKSTLLAAVSGGIQPIQGRVILEGADVTPSSVERRARLGLARTFQQPALWAGMTVFEHLLLTLRVNQSPNRVWRDFATFRGLRNAVVDAVEHHEIDKLLVALQLEGQADHVVDRLSLGKARIVEVGRALITRPRVVLLDEPFAGLDHRETTALCNVLTEVVADHGTSFMLVDHDVETVLSISTWMTVLNFGRVLATGPPAAIRQSPEVLEAYFGSDAPGSSVTRERVQA